MPRTISIASSSASTLSPGVRRGPPIATIASQNPPAPSPNASRPPESGSRLAAARASTAGGRNGRLCTFAEICTLEVCAATQVMSVQVSKNASW